MPKNSARIEYPIKIGSLRHNQNLPRGRKNHFKCIFSQRTTATAAAEEKQEEKSSILGAKKVEGRKREREIFK
jgi:hypothetical protein